MVEQQKIEVELYKLKDRINQLFFGVLLIDEQLKQVQMLKKDIQSGINKVEGALSNGAALKSGVDVLKAELLKNQQHETELTSARKSYLTMLGLFINKKTDENTSLQKPRDLALVSVVNRPEIGLFELQKKNIALQNTLIGARNFPRIGLFVQAGYGKPALNFLKNQFKPYYVGGLKISWSLAGFYTEKKDRLQLDLNSQSLDIQKETFLFNTNVSLSQQKEDIQKIEALIKTDGEIIILRTSIKNAVNGQLTYGTITSSDYLREVNAEDQARQNLLIHNIQLLMTQYTYNAMAGN
jgi:outer membrane protein TolC